MNKLPFELVWLASYPKSGNTWFRVFLENYIHNNTKAMLINDLMHEGIDKRYFDKMYGISSSDLDFSEIERRKPRLINQWVKSGGHWYQKTHDAYTYLPNAEPLLGSPCNQAGIYIIRNPLDVAVSYSYYFLGKADREALDITISQMNSSTNALTSNDSSFQLFFNRRLLSWGEHVLSWKQAKISKLILRYEDMLLSPFETFRKAICFLKLPDDIERIERAIEFSHFTELQKQEKKGFFKEKFMQSNAFFREGKAGGYNKYLKKNQIDKIVYANREVMREFGYLEEL